MNKLLDYCDSLPFIIIIVGASSHTFTSKHSEQLTTVVCVEGTILGKISMLKHTSFKLANMCPPILLATNCSLKY